jgi:hypothetical protein
MKMIGQLTTRKLCLGSTSVASICFQYFIVERKTLEIISFESTICHRERGEHNVTDHVLGALLRSVMLITI